MQLIALLAYLAPIVAAGPLLEDRSYPTTTSSTRSVAYPTGGGHSTTSSTTSSNGGSGGTTYPTGGGSGSGGSGGGSGSGGSGGGSGSGGSGGGSGSGGSGGGSGSYKACPNSMFSNALCCDADALELVDVDCISVPSTPTSNANFRSICAGLGKDDRCCMLPILGQALLCEDPAN